MFWVCLEFFFFFYLYVYYQIFYSLIGEGWMKKDPESDPLPLWNKVHSFIHSFIRHGYHISLPRCVSGCMIPTFIAVIAVLTTQTNEEVTLQDRTGSTGREDSSSRYYHRSPTSIKLQVWIEQFQSCFRFCAPYSRFLLPDTKEQVTPYCVVQRPVCRLHFCAGQSQNRLQIVNYLSQYLLRVIPFLPLRPFHCVHTFQTISFFCKHTDTSNSPC